VIGFEVKGHVAVITLDRPQMRNAIDAAMTTSLASAFARLEDDDELWAGVLAANGPVFCAGADIKALARGEAEQMLTERGGFAGLCWLDRSKPLIAAVDGPAIGSGFEMVLACDLVVASTAATFALPEVQRALVPPAGGLFRLGGIIPTKVATELILTGDPLDVDRAYAFGLVNRVVEPGQATTHAVALAERLCANAPLAVKESIRVVLAMSRAADPSGWAATEAAYRKNIATNDFGEGLRAFAERREPSWSGT
jgi:enoyl-CoA hydratase